MISSPTIEQNLAAPLSAIRHMAWKEKIPTWEAEKHFSELRWEAITENLDVMQFPKGIKRPDAVRRIQKFHKKLKGKINLLLHRYFPFSNTSDFRNEFYAANCNKLVQVKDESGNIIEISMLAKQISELLDEHSKDDFFMAELYSLNPRGEKTNGDFIVHAHLFFSNYESASDICQALSAASAQFLEDERYY